MCCTRLAANTGRKKSSTICHLGAFAQLCWAISLQLRCVLTIGKKNLLSSNISSTCPHNMVNFGPLAAEISPVVWGNPANFSGFRVLSALLQWLRATEANQTARCLAVSWAGTLHIHFWGFLPRCGILRGAKFSVHPPSLALSYFGSVTVRHLSDGRKPNFAALSTGHHLYLAGQPSRWALAHSQVVVISPSFLFYLFSD